MNTKHDQIRQIQTVTDLGRMVREHRKDKGLTQDVAASLANVSTNFLSDFENGKPTAEIGKILHMLTTLGIELYAAQRGVLGKKIKDSR